ncbi:MULTISPECIES: MOSC domain-containing protein [Alphaproteobacteria]|uniref:MOSC domain-containing protein n=2 Tax=Alphaproteobacteria TaxID=28211 RepID=A0A512HGB4_9HYPH|nr:MULTISPECIES: MOSC domain-containing protein [Alphaproteobacteria]GEO84488.1 MOSC domain-containing protein [Ciceribacter naphthalenivorans]GLR22451.1 MOSC domain-containing protein [Ciceribacter naphthalenivorans]GLT05307.1 MOSC domain-containing protein [Sphingomonas psychrolutea]
MQISELNIYPLKSARGIPLPAVPVDARGLSGDRRMMMVDPSGHFITQRELPALATLTALPQSSHLHLALADGREMMVAPPHPERRMDVAIWKSIVSAAVAEDSVNQRLSDWFGREMKLVFFDGQASRTASVEWAGPDTPVAFADGYQVLVTTTGSLAALNADMAAHGEGEVGMERFRPNIVIENDEPWAEDRWATIDIGGIRFDLVKPCARCIMTTQDQHSGSRDTANPMPAMGRIRMSADRRVPGPLFGWNAVPRSEGRITVGDEVSIVETRPDGWPLKQRRYQK